MRARYSARCSASDMSSPRRASASREALDDRQRRAQVVDERAAAAPRPQRTRASSSSSSSAISPRSSAIAIACTRLRACSLRMTLRTWVRTVSTETLSSSADRLRRPALGHQVHDLALARRELRARCAVARGESRMRSRRGSTYEPPAATRSIAPTQLVHRAGLQRVAAGAGVEAARRAARRRCRRCRGSRRGPAGGRAARGSGRSRCRRAGGCRRSRRPASACSTRSRPAATLPAAPTTSIPCLASSAARPSRRASWSSTMTSFVMARTYPRTERRKPGARAASDVRADVTRSTPSCAKSRTAGRSRARRAARSIVTDEWRRTPRSSSASSRSSRT